MANGIPSLAQPPTATQPGTSNTNAPAGMAVGSTPILDYLKLLKDDNQNFEFVNQDVRLIGLLEDDLHWRFRAPYTLTATGEAIGAPLKMLAGLIGGASNSPAIAGLANSRFKAQTRLSWDSSDANYIQLTLKWTLIAIYDSSQDVLQTWLDASKLVLPHLAGGVMFEAPLNGVPGTLRVGKWLTIPQLFVTELRTDTSQVVMVDGKPFYKGLEMDLVSQYAIGWEDLVSYVHV